MVQLYWEMIFMLLERLYYPNDYPIRISIAALAEDPLHYHTDIEFVYVLKGEIELKNGYYTYHLHAGDIFTNSGNEVHGMRAVTEDNVVAQIHVRTKDLSHYFPDLSKACYRTYSKKATDKRYERLRELLLSLLLKNELKDFNYKNECLYLMVDIIKHLNKYFNLFAFDKNMVVGFDRSNEVAVERISRICQYLYQNYASNITLEDLSRMEHLSSYYISHLIKDFTGMNFREFLCFARVEMSEARLLGSDHKISQIAGEVGFSTTAYYKKYFEKWFGHDPQTHREIYRDAIKSDLNPAVYTELAPGRAIAAIRAAYANYDPRQMAENIVSSMNLEMEVDADAKPLFHFGRNLQVVVTPADFLALGTGIFETLNGLAATKVILQGGKDKEEDKRIQALLSLGFSVENRETPGKTARSKGMFACDSIVYPIWLVDRFLKDRQTPTEIFLRDTDSSGEILQGQPSPLTAGGIKKPSYFIHAALSRVKGDMIAQGSQCGVIRTLREGRPAYAIFAYNYSDALKNICQKEMDKMEVKRLIDDFRDEMDLAVSLNLKPGEYSVVKYRLTQDNNIFAHLASLNFRSDAVSAHNRSGMMSDYPLLETYIENVNTALNVNFSMKGAGIQLAIVRQCNPL